MTSPNDDLDGRTNSFQPCPDNFSVPNQRASKIFTGRGPGNPDDTPDSPPDGHRRFGQARRSGTGLSDQRIRSMPEEVNIQVLKRCQILLREHPSWWYCSLIAVLLVAIVVHFGVRYRHIPPLAGFIIIFISLLPLAYQVSEATDRLGNAIRNSIVAVLITVFLSNAVELAFSLVAVSKKANGLTTQGLLGSAVENIILGLSGASVLNGLYQKNLSPKKPFLLTSRLQFYCLSANALVLLSLTVPYHVLHGQSRPVLHVLFIAYHSVTLAGWLIFVAFQARETQKHRANESQLPQPDSPRNGSPGLVFRWIQKHTALLSVVNLSITAVVLGALSDFLVDDVIEFYHGPSLIPEWVGVILIPIGSNLAEKAIIVTIAISQPDEWESIICTTIGSAWQIIGFVLPIVYFTGLGVKVNLEDYYDWKLVCLLAVVSVIATLLYQKGRNNLKKGLALGLIGSALLITVVSSKITY